MRKVCRVWCVSLLALPLLNCASIYELSVDPGEAVPVERIFKALRCEIVTFLELNGFRRTEFDKQKKVLGYEAAYAKYAFLDLDNTKYGQLQVDLKTVDSLGLAVGVDWKILPQPPGRSETWHVGPSLNANKTYTRTTAFAIPQDALLGTSVREKPAAPRLSVNDTATDRDFFCYVEPATATPLRASLENLQALAAHQIPEIESFDRIFVDGRPLAQWLGEKVSAEASKSSVAMATYMESVYAGQIQYSFALQVKPSIDPKYTLVARVISPLVPSLTASRENTGTFSLLLNTTFATAAAGAKAGTAIIASSKAPPVWGPTAPTSALRTSRQPLPPRRGPGIELEYPLPILTLPSPAQ